jgi:competence protein ComEA
MTVVELNSGTVDELNALPGLGTAKAEAIVDGRPSTLMDDLVSKGIVSKAAFEKFKDLATVTSGGDTKKVKKGRG